MRIRIAGGLLALSRENGPCRLLRVWIAELPISVEIRDGVVLHAEPEGLMAYVSVPFWKWFDDIPDA